MPPPRMRKPTGMTIPEVMVALAVTSLILAGAVGSLKLVAEMRQRKSFERSVAAQAESLLGTLKHDIATASRMSFVEKQSPLDGFSTTPADVFAPGQLVLVQPSWSPEGALLAEMAVVGYVWDAALRRLTRIEVSHVVNGVSFLSPKVAVLSDNVTAFSMEWDERQPALLQTGLRVRFTLTQGPFRREFRAYVVFRNGGVV